MDATLIPIVAITFSFSAAVVIVGLALFFSSRKHSMLHKERLAAIEKGIALPNLAKGEKPCKTSLQRGVTLLFVGAGLALALYVSADPEVAVWGAFVAIIGLGHLFYWFIRERHEEQPQKGQNGCC